MPDQPFKVPAGNIRVWLGQIVNAIDLGRASSVPCQSCTACCRASQFILVSEQDAGARTVIPAELLFPAPGLPPGNHVMGYDTRGQCPMFGADGCSIYEHRPQACRTYDCRIFAATGIDVASDGRSELATRVARWEFEAEGSDASLLAALKAAGEFVSSNANALGVGSGTTAQAIAAITRIGSE